MARKPMKLEAIITLIPHEIPSDAPPRISRHGVPWNDNQWRAAIMKAYGATWPQIAGHLKLTESTVTKYSQRKDWMNLRRYFESNRSTVIMDSWLEDEEEAVILGASEAIECLRSIIRGDVQPNGKRPSNHTRARFSVKYLEVVGYSDTKRALAVLQAQEAFAQASDEEDEEIVEVDDTMDPPELEYTDFDEEE